MNGLNWFVIVLVALLVLIVDIESLILVWAAQPE